MIGSRRLRGLRARHRGVAVARVRPRRIAILSATISRAGVAGLACHNEMGTGVCRAYCGGPMNVPCPNGQMCVDLSVMVKKAVIGICSR